VVADDHPGAPADGDAPRVGEHRRGPVGEGGDITEAEPLLQRARCVD
jgi:hypothetical protein